MTMKVIKDNMKTTKYLQEYQYKKYEKPLRRLLALGFFELYKEEALKYIEELSEEEE
jgi:hypothetical protein